MSDRVCVTGREVRDFIDNYKFTRRNLKKDNELFNAMRTDIKEQITFYGKAEEDFYRKFNLHGGLPEFQKRFDEILSGNLHLFSNAYLQQSNLFQKFNTITNDDIEEYITDFLKKEIPEIFEKKKISDIILTNAATKLAEKIQEEARTAHKEDYTKQVGEVKSFYLKGRIKDLVKGKKINPGEYKKDFKILMENEGSGKWTNSTYDMDFDVTFSIGDNSDIEEAFMPLDELSYYPYFGLTESQKKEAKELKTEQSKRVWHNFKDHIKSFLVGDISGQTIDAIMNQLGPYAFIQNSLSGVKGILGELQMLFVTAKLMGEKNVGNRILATGPLRNRRNKSAELGADVLIDSTIGLQVKNYKGHSIEGKQVNYWLKSDLSFSTFSERVKENGDFVDFDKYVAILNYNQPNWAGKGRGARGLGFNKQSYEKYENYYNKKIAGKSGVINSTTKLLVAENMDKFLTLQESAELLSGDLKDLYMKKDYVNAFYIFGGKNIIPVRVIFELLLRRINELEKAILWKKSAQTNNFYVGYNYQGTVWPVDVIKDQDANYLTNKTIQSVLDDLRIELKLNIWLSDLNLTAHATRFK